MTDLVGWLTAILDEREEVALREQKNDWDRIAGYADSWLVQLMSPAAVLADIAAKRAILHDHRPVTYTGIDGPCCARCESYMAHPCPTTRHIGSAYAHEPGYLEEWKP